MIVFGRTTNLDVAQWSANHTAGIQHVGVGVIIIFIESYNDRLTLNLSSSSCGPIPDNIKIWGDITAPADRITSLLLYTVCSLPSRTNCTPMARLCSKRTYKKNTWRHFKKDLQKEYFEALPLPPPPPPIEALGTSLIDADNHRY